MPVGGTELFYRIEGSGVPVVLIPGANVDQRIWTDAAEVLARNYQVITYDPRGYGRSEGWGEPYRAADDLVAMLDRLRLDRPALGGVSLGARIAIDAAVEYPERVSSLVLLSPGLSGYQWSAAGYQWYSAVSEAAAVQDTAAIVEGWLQSPFMRPVTEDPQMRARLADLTADNIRVWLCTDTEVGYPTPAIERLDELRIPTLIIIGEADTPDVRSIGDVLRRGISNSELISLSGVGHLPHLEAPDTTEALIVRFLDDRQPRS